MSTAVATPVRYFETIQPVGPIFGWQIMDGVCEVWCYLMSLAESDPRHGDPSHLAGSVSIEFPYHKSGKTIHYRTDVPHQAIKLAVSGICCGGFHSENAYRRFEVISDPRTHGFNHNAARRFTQCFAGHLKVTLAQMLGTGIKHAA